MRTHIVQVQISHETYRIIYTDYLQESLGIKIGITSMVLF